MKNYFRCQIKENLEYSWEFTKNWLGEWFLIINNILKQKSFFKPVKEIS